MRRVSRSLLFSPSDLNAYLECEHLGVLELRVARGELRRPERDNAQAELIRRKGEEHEDAFLRELEAQRKHVVALRNSFLRRRSTSVLCSRTFATS